MNNLKNNEDLYKKLEEYENLKISITSKISELYELISIEKDLFYYNHISEYFHTIITLKDLLK